MRATNIHPILYTVRGLHREMCEVDRTTMFLELPLEIGARIRAR